MGETWIAALLPYIEQENIEVDSTLGTGGGSVNLQLITMKFNFMQCPSDETRGGVSHLGGGPPWDPSKPECYIRGNYAGNNGAGPMQWTTDPFCGGCAIPRTPGIFMNNSHTNWRDVKDGTTNTVMVAELIQGAPGTSTIEGGWQGVMMYWEGCLYQHEYTPNSSRSDQLRRGWCGTPPETPCIETYGGTGDTNLILTARSRHPGGVNVGLCDGSVQFVSDSIDPDTWRNLGNPNDGNVIDAKKF